MAKKQKILFVCTEDWFFQSHFTPLGEAAVAHGDYEVAVVTTIGDKRQQLERLGLKVLSVDFMRSSQGVLSAIKLLGKLIMLFCRERPDIIHFIALKPILVGGLAALFTPKTATVYHLTGLGYLADGKSKRALLARNICFRLVTLYLKRCKSWLIVENPDDLKFLESFGTLTVTRTSMFGGAGVDPDFFPELPPAEHQITRAAYVGRMIWSKGVDILIEAKDMLTKKEVELELDMFGAPDSANPLAIQAQTLKEWNRRPGVRWHGLISDVREVWRDCEIAVVPTRTREGMPRAMLEAAACGRALIVTDVPGCRHFVRHGVEGLIVPPENPEALAEAMKTLAVDPGLRHRMGRAARSRILAGYTESHVREAVLKIYEALLEKKTDE